MRMINNALRILRLYYGMSQSELAHKLDVSQSLISEVERDNKAVTLGLLEKYSQALGIKMSKLLFFAEEMEGEPPATRGKLLIAGKTLALLEKIAPSEPLDAAP
ncbi:helix-turn-helix domain-containing protein [Limimaricola sp. AA108-03]|uniref:helix-turn-helix domain-containing protein n=1 Tax=Limimaricola sp. AA108-03 TaxID=3425945 RepID=UPI003D777D7D